MPSEATASARRTAGEAVDRYLDHWITSITDITQLAAEIHRDVDTGDLDAARAALPAEYLYPLPRTLKAIVGAT